jgi:hypothetical protein
MVKMKTLLLILTIILSGCATQEYVTTYNQCKQKMLERYPIKNIEKFVSRTRAVQVPTGRTECITTYRADRARTVCNEIFDTRYDQVQEKVIIDSNEVERDKLILSCTQTECQYRYRNISCEKK